MPKFPELNEELLCAVADYILAHPSNLDMEYGVTVSSCGTVGCIAGTACLLYVQDQFNRPNQFSSNRRLQTFLDELQGAREEVERLEEEGLETIDWTGVIQPLATDLLGLTEKESDNLFFMYLDDSH